MLGNYQPIENYGVIGDLNTIALVGMNGSIDYMCYPEFDSPTIFAKLLDHEKGGCFEVTAIHERAKPKQMYLPDTNILLTRFLSPQGVGEVTDFMPVRSEKGGDQVLIRRVSTARGSVTFRMCCKPRFNYGRSGHKAQGKKHTIIFESEDGVKLRLTASVPLEVKGNDGYAEFTLNSDENVYFVLEEASAPVREAIEDYVSEELFETMEYWKSWVSRSKYQGLWREEVNRSALVLKMLTSQKYGSIMAAGTFGLPEQIGGDKNWDYRYTWIRDASFTVYAFMRLGYTREAGRFMKWVENRCAEIGDNENLQLMYGLDGRHKLDEWFLDDFEGYRKSKPVRVGNAAYSQIQLDIYGELMDSVYLYDKYGETISYDFWEDLVAQLNWLCENCDKKGQGIWEVRGESLTFLYSRLMIWVALDRGIRLSRKRSLPRPAHWEPLRDKIYKQIFEEFWDDKRKCFTQAKETKRLDAAVLLMPLVRFIGPTDPRWLSTLKAINEDLVSDSLVYRYILDPKADKSSNDEGTFSICTFWYVECLSRAGYLQEARFYFEKMLSYSNHLGLYSEELGPQGEHLGNFPQAFTHLALISAAWNLNIQLNDRHNCEVERGKAYI